MKKANGLLIAGMLTGVAGVAIVPSVSVVEVEASSSVQLSFSKTTDQKGKITVRFGSGTKKVLLPNGSTVTSSTSITVDKNKTYDFVSYDSNDRPTQHHIEVTQLDVDPAPLTTANGLTIKMKVDAFDTISEMKDYRYRLASSSNWTSWKAYKPNNSQEITIPNARKGSYVDDEEVVVQARDHANNIQEVKTAFRVDNYHPTIHTYSETIYTNDSSIKLPFVVDSYFKRPHKLTIQEGSKEKTYNLDNLNPKETLLERRPSLLSLDYNNQMDYTIDTTFEGPRELIYDAVKTHTDFKGKSRNLSSAAANKHSVRVVYDVTKPTGNIEIETDSKGEVRTHDVLINLDFYDKHGVQSVRVYEGNKEYELKPSEIENGKLEDLPWTLGVNNRSVFMDVVDRAGNKRTYESNDVIISNINVSNFKITDVVNPAIYASETFETREWPFNGEHVSMLAGSNFDFEIHYDLSDVNPNRYKITGEYRITIVDDGEEIYRSEPVPYNPNDHPSGEHHRKGDKDEDGHGYFATTFTLPSIDENDQPFSETAKVYISSELKRTEIADGTVITTTFENELSEYGNLIGILGHYGEGGSVSIDDMIRFNQRH